MDRATQIEGRTGPRQREEDSGGSGFARTRLRVEEVMNASVVTAAPGESVLAAARRMCTQNVSCLVAVEDGVVVGIFTQKDLVLGVARGRQDYDRLAVGQCMSSSPVVVAPDVPVLEAGQLLKSRHVKHLPVVAGGRLVGIVTQSDITRGLIYLAPLQCVREVMSPKVATIGVEASTVEAARIMQSQDISCVVVMHVNEVIGIVSQKDLLYRVVSLRKKPAYTSVADVMSTPALPIPPDYSVFTASRIMDRMRIHRLVVQDHGRVCGIVSQTDILRAVERRLTEEEDRRLSLACPDIPTFTLDANGRLAGVNAAFLTLLAATQPQEVVGRTLSDLGFRSSAANGEQPANLLDKGGRSGLLRLVLKAGTGRRKRIVLLLAATRDAGGGIRGWQGVAWPITDRAASKGAFCRNRSQAAIDFAKSPPSSADKN
jgi:CBS domain-containing protein